MSHEFETTAPPRPATQAVEWPTVLLAVAVYGGWIAATLFHDRLPTPVLIVVGGWLVAWHGSLQHEVIHGHPTPWRRVNDAIGWPPLSLWLPYEFYRRSHLAHHASERLTCPAADPESRYLPATAGRGEAFAARLQATLAGRLVLGPFIGAGGFLLHGWRALRDGESGAPRIWLGHLLGVAAVLGWLQVCGLSVWLYLACFVYPGAALSLIRSFAEHRAEGASGHRVAVVERAPVLGLLFLNNNLHAVHHAWPGVAWWRLPARYRRARAALLANNGGLVYRGYAEVFARYLFRPHDALRHPGAAPLERAA